jgi:hypothetical protein
MSTPLQPRPPVLVTEGGSGQSRAAVAAVRALSVGGYEPVVSVSGGRSLAAASRYCARRVHVPFATERGYAHAIREELSRHPYVTVLPTSDRALLALDAPGVGLVDKVRAADRARAAGLSVPPSRVFGAVEEVMAASRHFDYPVVVKPAIKTSAARKVASAAELPGALVEDGPVIVQPYLTEQLNGVLGVVWEGSLVAAAHIRYLRIWPLPCGTVAAAETVAPDENLEARLTSLLGDYRGIFHVDLAGQYVLDVNPRVHATLPLAAASGANLVSIYCDLLRGQRVPTVRGRSGNFFRWVEGDVRSVIRSVRTGQLGLASALRALRPRRGAVHGYESLRDPGPLLARLRYLPKGRRRGPTLPERMSTHATGG